MPSVKQCPRQARVERHATMAANAFRGHQIEQLHDSGLYRQWRCWSPELGSIYQFYITTFPGALVVTGDVGTLVVERTADMIAWARGAVKSIDYFAEKVPHGFVVEEYCPEYAKWVVAELIRECESDRDEAIDKESLVCLEDEDYQAGPHNIYEVLEDTDLVDPGDLPNLTNYTSGFLWCRECVKWFLEHWPESNTDATDGSGST